MKAIYLTILLLGLLALQNQVFGQTLTSIEEHNWKVVEIYADSVLVENDQVYLRFSKTGTLLSDDERLIPGSPTFAQRSVSNDTYAVISSPTYLSSTTNTLEVVESDETTLWDILHEDLNTLILFKYDTIPASSIESGIPYIFPVELRLVKDDL